MACKAVRSVAGDARLVRGRSAPRPATGRLGALWPLVAIALVLTGCSSEWTLERERSLRAFSTVPTNYKSEIVAFMRSYLNEPGGVRGAFVSEPTQRTIAEVNRYTVCLRYNARKSGGQYAGSKDSLVLFADGRLDRVIDNARDQCKDAAFQPFPELERMSR